MIMIYEWMKWMMGVTRVLRDKSAGMGDGMIQMMRMLGKWYIQVS